MEHRKGIQRTPGILGKHNFNYPAWRAPFSSYEAAVFWKENDQREIPLHYFYHWFQKPVICTDYCTDYWLVQWDFSLNGAGLFCPPGFTFYSRSCGSIWKFWMAISLSGMIFPWLIPCLFGDTGIEPAELDLWSEEQMTFTGGFCGSKRSFTSIFFPSS